MMQETRQNLSSTHVLCKITNLWFFNTLCYWVYNCTVFNFLHETRSTSLIAYNAKQGL